MNRRSIVFLLVLAALLGLFFQLTRSSSFWQAASFRNAAHQRMTAQEPWSEAADIARDHFVILYDPTEVPSMFTRHNAETMLQEQKKSFESHSLQEAIPIPSGTQAVLLATGRVESLAAQQAVLDYVRAGGTLLVLQYPGVSDWKAAPAAWRQALGIAGMGPAMPHEGLDFRTDFLVGSKGLYLGLTSDMLPPSPSVRLADDAVTEIAYGDGMPMLGKFLPVEGRDGQSHGRGILPRGVVALDVRSRAAEPAEIHGYARRDVQQPDAGAVPRGGCAQHGNRVWACAPEYGRGARSARL